MVIFFGRLRAMSAAVLGQLLSACAGASSAASSAVWAASLPPTCREGLAHAALTCSGATPRYFTPGFGPLALACGVAAVGRPPRPALSPSGGRVGRLGRWTCAAVCTVAGRPCYASLQPAHSIQYLLQGCDAALSQVANRIPTAVMAHPLTDCTVADAAARRPANEPARRRSRRH